MRKLLVRFESGSDLPKLYDSLEIKREDGSTLILEVQQHVGEDTVRSIAMDSTDGLSRGYEVVSTGNAIQMPVGEDIYGRLFNIMIDQQDSKQQHQIDNGITKGLNSNPLILT